MKKTELQERIAEISERAAQENKGELGEARMLFDEMVKEARRQSEIEREEARQRSPFVKALLALALVSVCAGVAIGGYGIYNFPDAPLRRKGEVYTGKHGQLRTREDYERFVTWEKALIGAFASTFFFAFAFGIADARERKRRKAV